MAIHGRAHPRGVPLGALILLTSACGGTPAPTGPIAPGPGVVERVAVPDPAVLEDRIRSAIAEAPAGAEVSVALFDLSTGVRIEIAGDIEMHAASTMKVPVMLEVFRQAESGELSLDERIRVTNRFRSIAADSMYRLSPESDSDRTLYERTGSTASVRELVRLMIARSSNLALNLLIERVGVDRVQATLAEIGADEMQVRRGVEDIAAFEAGLNNVTTAHGLAVALDAIARCSITRRASCDEMMEVLGAQEFNEMIPAGLPDDVRVAHKTGWITGIRHDGGVVFPPGRAPFILVIMTRGFGDAADADRLGAGISRIVWNQLNDPSFVAGVRVTDPAVRDLLELHGRHRHQAIALRHFGHAQLWSALEPLTMPGGTIERSTAGRSAEGRDIDLLRYGTGSTRVLLWSQMHGNESTATMALVDLVNYLADRGPDDRKRAWSDQLTVLMVPMLNPDGAERFQRHDIVGIDVNRDARDLATPEGRTLKAVRDEWQPDFGFNLHDQNPRTRVGSSQRLAAISLLAPALDAEATATPKFVLAQHLAATVRRAVEPLVGGYITRYDDTFNARAFGDLMQQWGTSTVLIESGGWRHDPEKQYLRAVNFVALVSALDAIAADSVRATPIALYEGLPGNGRSANDLLIRRGTIVLPGAVPVRADLTVDFEGGSGSPERALIMEIGDLAGVLARDTIDADGLYLHPFPVPSQSGNGLVPGADASFTVRTGESPESTVAFVIDRGHVRTVTDARRARDKPDED